MERQLLPSEGLGDFNHQVSPDLKVLLHRKHNSNNQKIARTYPKVNEARAKTARPAKEVWYS